MANSDEVIDMAKILAILGNEEELIIKPFQPGKNIFYKIIFFFFDIQGAANEIGAIECGKIVSRLNKALFDYQIGKIIQKMIPIKIKLYFYR
jgi:hypothetical protein